MSRWRSLLHVHRAPLHFQAPPLYPSGNILGQAAAAPTIRQTSHMDHKSTGPDVWGSAVASGDAVKVSQMVVEWSASKPEVALSFLRKCVALVEEDLAYCSGRLPPSSTPARPDGFLQNTSLDAFGMVLSQSCDGRGWFSSTKELQLASLEFCAACRNVATMTLRVDDAVPRSLLTAADAPPPDRKRLCTTRVPRLRARRVLWDLPTAMELRRPMYALDHATCLSFGGDFADTLEGVEWPRRLRVIKIDCNLVSIRRLTGVVWPTSLQQISFGDSFNQPLWGVALPGCLRQLTFGGGFNQSAKNIMWPASLQQLTFGHQFDRPIEGVVWPTSLQRLTFGYYFNRPLVGVVWPKSLQQLTLGESFSQTIRGVVWPASLQQLTFGYCFNQPMEGTEWPTCLQKVTFGDCFNQPLQEVVWPPILHELTLGYHFNRPIEGVQWPVLLQQLTFGYCFNQPMEGTEWPTSLQKLTFGVCFNQTLQDVVWPPILHELTLGFDFNRSIEGVQWPMLLQQLTIGNYFNQPIERVKWPNSLQQLTFGYNFNQPIDQVAWPNSLKHLSFGRKFNQPVEGVIWPTSLEELGFGSTHRESSLAEAVYMKADFNQAIGRAQWPALLRRFTLGGDFSCPCAELGAWMPNLEELTLLLGDPSSYGRLLRGVKWPESLRKLTMFDDAGLHEVVIPREVQVVRHARLT